LLGKKRIGEVNSVVRSTWVIKEGTSIGVVRRSERRSKPVQFPNSQQRKLRSFRIGASKTSIAETPKNNSHAKTKYEKKTTTSLGEKADAGHRLGKKREVTEPPCNGLFARPRNKNGRKGEKRFHASPKSSRKHTKGETRGEQCP